MAMISSRISISLFNGCRIGEAVALELKNYRKNEGLLDIHGTLDSVDRHAEKTSTKTASGFRTTHLTKREMEILDEIIAMNALSAELNPDWPESDYIFLSKEGKPIQRNAFNVSLQKANAVYSNSATTDQNNAITLIRMSISEYAKKLPDDNTTLSLGYEKAADQYDLIAKSSKQKDIIPVGEIILE